MKPVPDRDRFMSCDEVEAAVAADRALLAGDTDAPRRQLLFNLARSLQARYGCREPKQGTGSPDLDEAIDCLNEALREIPAEAPVHSTVLSELTESLMQRGGPGDAAEASRLSDDVLASMPAGTLNRGIAAASSAPAQYQRFIREDETGP